MGKNKRRSKDLYKDLDLEKFISLIEKELPFPKTSPLFLGKILNEFIERFEKKEYHAEYLGLFISGFINRNIDHYIEKEKKEGKKMEEIKEVIIKLNVENLKKTLILSWFSK